MKRFSDIPSVVHAFAHQTYPECETYNGNVKYHDGVIYSYGHHFPMGRLLGDNRVLLTNRSYSVSTTNHKSRLRDAVNHMQKHYCYNPENPLGREAVVQTLMQIEQFLKSAANRRSGDLATADFRAAMTLFDEIEWLRAWEKSNKRTVAQWHDWLGWRALPDDLKLRWRAMKKTLEAAALDVKAALGKMSEARKRRDKAAAKRREQQLERDRVRAREALEVWQRDGARLAGFRDIKRLLQRDGLRLHRTYLSVDRGGDWIEWAQTTQGVNVPADDCRKAWPLIKAGYGRLDSSGIHVDFDDRVRASARLGDFAPTGIMRDGTLVVGCHHFTRESVENLAKALGLS